MTKTIYVVTREWRDESDDNSGEDYFVVQCAFTNAAKAAAYAKAANEKSTWEFFAVHETQVTE